jgi:hypothetical protein
MACMKMLGLALLARSSTPPLDSSGDQRYYAPHDQPRPGDPDRGSEPAPARRTLLSSPCPLTRSLLVALVTADKLD